jgi:hypothetical protein
VILSVVDTAGGYALKCVPRTEVNWRARRAATKSGLLEGEETDTWSVNAMARQLVRCPLGIAFLPRAIAGDGEPPKGSAGRSRCRRIQAKVAEATTAPVGVTSFAPRSRPTSTRMAFDSTPLPPWSLNAPVATVEPSATCSLHTIEPV